MLSALRHELVLRIGGLRDRKLSAKLENVNRLRIAIFWNPHTAVVSVQMLRHQWNTSRLTL